MRTLLAQPLTRKAFAPFGDVVAAESADTTRLINEGHTTRFHNLADVFCREDTARLTVNIFRSSPRGLPVTLRQLERHPKASQMFMPLSSRPYLVVVAPKGAFDPAKMIAFVARGDQGVNYHAGTWHHYSLALEEQSDFLVVDYADVKDNCDLVDLPEAVQVVLP